MSQVFKRGPTKPTMNITPLIDVVFLLIVFFMLVNNIVSENNEPMIVPELIDPQTYDLGDADRLVVNVVPQDVQRSSDNPLVVPGEPAYVRVGTSVHFDPRDPSQIVPAVQAARAARPEIEVILRADAGLYYEGVEPIMTALADAGVEKINLSAYLPSDGPVEPPSVVP